ncbi:unnamed protein product [Amoebophrya sp. A120]|nr:unnamed protein product [Amoebophrya sp. A120]|eukprot:GSA120T00017441001.1
MTMDEHQQHSETLTGQSIQYDDTTSSSGEVESLRGGTRGASTSAAEFLSSTFSLRRFSGRAPAAKTGDAQVHDITPGTTGATAFSAASSSASAATSAAPAAVSDVGARSNPVVQAKDSFDPDVENDADAEDLQLVRLWSRFTENALGKSVIPAPSLVLGVEEEESLVFNQGPEPPAVAIDATAPNHELQVVEDDATGSGTGTGVANTAIFTDVEETTDVPRDDAGATNVKQARLGEDAYPYHAQVVTNDATEQGEQQDVDAEVGAHDSSNAFRKHSSFSRRHTGGAPSSSRSPLPDNLSDEETNADAGTEDQDGMKRRPANGDAYATGSVDEQEIAAAPLKSTYRSKKVLLQLLRRLEEQGKTGSDETTNSTSASAEEVERMENVNDVDQSSVAVQLPGEKFVDPKRPSVMRNLLRRLIPPMIERHVTKNVNEHTFPTWSAEDLLIAKYTWAAKLTHFQKYGSFSEGNSLQILETGDVGFPVMLEAIQNATHRVWLESYILDESGIADRFVDALVAAKQRGVKEVVLVVDGIGSRDMPEAAKARLVEHGVKLIVFNPPDNWKSFLWNSGAPAPVHQQPPSEENHIGGNDASKHEDAIATTAVNSLYSGSASSSTSSTNVNFLHPWPLRDHRKILICDDTGFCGSLNVMKEDCGPALGGCGGFYDVHVKLEGPVVQHLAEVFLDSLAEAGEEAFAQTLTASGPVLGEKEKNIKAARRPSTTSEEAEGVYIQVVRSNMRLRARNRSLQKVLTKAMYGALHSLHITTPYFFPPLFLRRSLWRQLRNDSNDVHMSFLLSGVSDVSPIPYDTLGQKHVIRKLLVEDKRRAERLTRARTMQQYEDHADDENRSAGIGGELRAASDPRPGDDGTRLEVYLSENEHMHAKIVVVDQLFSSIGSFNFDWFSGRRNLEVGVCIFDHKVAQKFEKLHRDKLERERQQREQKELPAGVDELHSGRQPQTSNQHASSGLHTWWGVPLPLVPDRRPTVRRQTLEQWEYTHWFPRAVSFWAYNSVWFASCNIFDGLDHVAALKRRMKLVREELRRERQALLAAVQQASSTSTSSRGSGGGINARTAGGTRGWLWSELDLRRDRSQDVFARREAERRARAEERYAFTQMQAVHVV